MNTFRSERAQAAEGQFQYAIRAYNRDTGELVSEQEAASLKFARSLRDAHVRDFPNDRVEIKDRWFGKVKADHERAFNDRVEIEDQWFPRKDKS